MTKKWFEIIKILKATVWCWSYRFLQKFPDFSNFFSSKSLTFEDFPYLPPYGIMVPYGCGLFYDILKQSSDFRKRGLRGLLCWRTCIPPSKNCVVMVLTQSIFFFFSLTFWCPLGTLDTHCKILRSLWYSDLIYEHF